MSELGDGVDLGSEFSFLGLVDKERILEQIAGVLAAIQVARLTEDVTQFGGLTFDSSGRIVSGESPLLNGAAGSYSEWRIGKLRALL